MTACRPTGVPFPGFHPTEVRHSGESRNPGLADAARQFSVISAQTGIQSRQRLTGPFPSFRRKPESRVGAGNPTVLRHPRPGRYPNQAASVRPLSVIPAKCLPRTPIRRRNPGLARAPRPSSVIPAQAGIQNRQRLTGPCPSFRRRPESRVGTGTPTVLRLTRPGRYPEQAASVRPLSVIPAKAGIQSRQTQPDSSPSSPPWPVSRAGSV